MMLFFNRPGGLKLEQSHVNRRLLKEFLPYPLCTHLLLKVFLAADYVFVALRNYNLALHFRDVYLLNLLRSRRKEAANE